MGKKKHNAASVYFHWCTMYEFYLNNFIFEAVFCKGNPGRQQSTSVRRGDTDNTCACGCRPPWSPTGSSVSPAPQRHEHGAQVQPHGRGVYLSRLRVSTRKACRACIGAGSYGVTDGPSRPPVPLTPELASKGERIQWCSRKS